MTAPSLSGWIRRRGDQYHFAMTEDENTAPVESPAWESVRRWRGPSCNDEQEQRTLSG